MKKKIVGVFVCMFLITNIFYFPAIAIDEESNYEQDFNIEFIFAFGRVRDVEKYPEELFYQFRSVSLLIVWFYFYGIDIMGLMIDYSRGVAQGFQGFKFRGILTNRFILGFFLPSQ